MKKYRAFRVVKFVLLAIFAVIVFGYAVQHLWNWLIPPVIGWKPITFVQALGLLVLSKILFGGFHRGGHGGRGWNRHMDDRWAKMSDEDRERFRAGMRGGRGCYRRSESAPTPEQRGA